MTEIKRLRRSRADRTLAGVIGGLAEYFGVDPTMARAAFLLAVRVGHAPASSAVPEELSAIIEPEKPGK